MTNRTTKLSTRFVLKLFADFTSETHHPKTKTCHLWRLDLESPSRAHPLQTRASTDLFPPRQPVQTSSENIYQKRRRFPEFSQ